MTQRFKLGLLVSAWLTLSCVSTPTSKSVVDAGTTQLRFAGEAPYRLAPDKPVTQVVIEVKRDDGSWHELKTTQVDKQGNFDVHVTVADNYWLKPCDLATFRLRTKPDDLSVRALDEQCLAALGPAPTDQEKNSCKTDRIEIQREVTHTGNVTITGDQQAAQYRCVTTLNGDLSVAGGLSSVVSLPHLRAVNGSMNVVLDKAVSVTPQGTTLIENTLAAPSLKRVTGALSLSMTSNSGSDGYWDFGLDALTYVGGDVTLTNPKDAGAHCTGLLNLTRAHKNLTINWQTSDYWEEHFAPHLARIDGDLSLNAPNLPLLQDMFHELTRVDGSVNIVGHGGFTHEGTLPQLATVGKDLLIDGFGLGGCGLRQLAKLVRVAGSMKLDHGNSDGFIGPKGAALSLGGLSISNDQTARLPLPKVTKVDSGGPVSLTDNSKLCQCQVDALVSSLEQNGWSGSAVTSGNKTSNQCAGCPVPACN